MRYGEYPMVNAEGLVLAHTIRFGKSILKKGRRLSTEDILRMQQAGIQSVFGARLEALDICEDKAARYLAKTIAGTCLDLGRSISGRCNLIANAAGIVTISQDVINCINLLSGAITVGTLAPWSVVSKGAVVATVKVIPFAVPSQVLGLCKEQASHFPINVAPFQARQVALIMSECSGTPQSVLSNTINVTSQRIEALGSKLIRCSRCSHEVEALKKEILEAYADGCDLIVISGASVTKDTRDIVPSAIAAAGGKVEHFGMPVDPGNMLLLAYIENVPVVNIPGCARSQRLNGFDLVLRRLLADIKVSARDIMLMGVGGLI